MDTSTFSTTALLAPPASPDAIASAKGHIRAAMRELSRLSVTLDCFADDDSFGQPTRATVALDELALALAELGEVRS